MWLCRWNFVDHQQKHACFIFSLIFTDTTKHIVILIVLSLQSYYITTFYLFIQKFPDSDIPRYTVNTIFMTRFLDSVCVFSVAEVIGSYLRCHWQHVLHLNNSRKSTKKPSFNSSPPTPHMPVLKTDLCHGVTSGRMCRRTENWVGGHNCRWPLSSDPEGECAPFL